MKIEQMQAVVNDRGHTQVFGMGTDGQIYRWSYHEAKWELYKITEKLQKE